MKCKRCRERAVAELPQHHMALCKDCYLEWFPAYTAKTIKKFDMLQHDERILLAVSGGKDSVALWQVLADLGYPADGLVIDLGIGYNGKAAHEGYGYSTDSTDYARRMAARLGRPLWVIDLRRFIGKTVPELQRGQRPVCSACGVVKRYFMNRVAFEGGYDCIATGHNLDDEVAALFGNVLTWDVGFLARKAPVSQQRGERLMKKVKPLCYFTERETAMYTMLSGIPYIHDECPNSVGATTISYKELINRLESGAPGSKRRFYDGFLQRRELFQNEETELTMAYCERCGMPSPLELCGFCRMVGDAPITEYGALERVRPQGAPPRRTQPTLTTDGVR
ncbi:MAG: ATP-binding protein [Acidobacteriota bacterium]|jgi:uncharacterized protein (TIGR00269 family)